MTLVKTGDSLMLNDTMADQLPLPALDTWQAMEVQLISFPMELQVGVEQQWWSSLTGSEGTSTRKRLERVDNGPFQGRDFTLLVDLARIIWKADFLPDPDAPVPMGIGDFVEVRDWFSQLMQRWMAADCPPIKRLAFAAKVLIPTASREESYNLLARYLKTVQVDPKSREFSYKINRPRQSTAMPGLRINRLNTWSSVNISFQMQMRVPSESAVRHVESRSTDGCLLQLDINTAEDRSEALPHQDLCAIWGELVSMANEIAERGDIP